MLRFAGFELVFLVLSVVACAAREPRLTIVVVDTSLTVTDYQPYQDAYRQVLATVSSGDGVVLVLVKGRVLEKQGTKAVSTAKPRPKELVNDTQLREIMRQEVPTCSWNRNPLDCNDEVRTTNKALSGGIETALQQPRSDHTALLATLDEVAKYFTNSRQQDKVLVLLSDMLEDSPEARFEVTDPSEKFTQEYIAKRKREKTLPALAGVRIFVAGAQAQNDEKLRNVERFWLQYLSAAGAEISHDHYGNRLIGFK